MIEKFTALAANSFMKIQFQNSIKKKGAVPVGRAPVDEWRVRKTILGRLEGVGWCSLAETTTTGHRIFKKHPPSLPARVAMPNECELGRLSWMEPQAFDLDFLRRRVSATPDASDDGLVDHFSIFEDFNFHPLCKVLFGRHYDLLSFGFIWNFQNAIHIATIKPKTQEAASAASWECLKNFSFLLLQNMVRADVFTGSLAVFRFAAKPLIFAGDFLAAAGGEMRSNYFKNGAPRRKSQCLARALPALGDQIVRSFRDKKKFPIPLKAEKKNFSKS